MQYNNDAKQLKYEVLTKAAKYAYEGTLKEHLDTIPYEIIPGPLPEFRCCVYREREIIRERLISARGENLPGQDDGNIVAVLTAACEGCPINRFNVTDNCQHCLAKKCHAACPFGAISITPKGAYIDPAKCKECGRCAAACPYNAISDTMRPCIRACPVKAITKDEYKRAAIDYSRCINCGACTKNCPFGAITDRSAIVNVIEDIKSGKPVYAVFAPAIEGHFGTANVGMLKSAIKKLGFTGVAEVSLGADATTFHEAQELREALESKQKMTTSCCPAFVEMIEKHFPKLVPLISHTASPMTLTVRYIKAEHPDSRVVFIGPCIAKKIEIRKVQDTADYVMTFEELQAMFSAREINVLDEAENEQDGSRAGKGFAQSGGVSGAVKQALEEQNFDLPFTCVKCNGASECKKTLTLLNAGRLEEDFVEGMACEGGCIAGPGGVEELQKLLKNRSRLMASADHRGILENIQNIHDFSKIKMTTDPQE
ncbi:4Fe-4S dicluster domain-containing protein [Clostridium sp. KNHs216]|uniref:4Fe-4S dicluster domain-containing protein n=1 Tax=Clostridium sp. KNHs216 TaxID=1550235 RepID=UPI001152748D|nr:4Fe-4S dicluster domain-containing protein [Clostridium sp. KNHs216]TQI65994.1 ferredoxin hydrogenase large subunit [Clostridium sp. KNHs216]